MAAAVPCRVWHCRACWACGRARQCLWRARTGHIGTLAAIEHPWNAEISYGSAAAMPTPRSNAPLKLSAACPPAGCSLRTWQVPGFLGASTSENELEAKTVQAMGEVIAFPAPVCWSHVNVWVRPTRMNRGMVGFLLKSFHAATGVKDLEGKFEVLMQDRYTFSLSRTLRQLRLREQPISPRHAPPPCTLLPGDHTPAHDHATSPLCMRMHTALALSHESEWPAVVEVSLETAHCGATIRDD